MLDNIDLEKILLKLCENHLEWEWIETVHLLEYFVYKSSKSNRSLVLRISNVPNAKVVDPCFDTVT